MDLVFPNKRPSANFTLKEFQEVVDVSEKKYRKAFMPAGKTGAKNGLLYGYVPKSKKEKKKKGRKCHIFKSHYILFRIYFTVKVN